MDNERHADFIQYYRERSEDGSSFTELWKLNKEFEAEDARLASQSGMTIQKTALKMDNIGRTTTFDAAPHRDALRKEYSGKADTIARQHGFKGMSYDDHVAEQKLQKQIGNALDGAAGAPLSEKERKRQEFKMRLQDAAKNLTKGKDRERD